LSWLADGAVIGHRTGGNWRLGCTPIPTRTRYSSTGVIESLDPPSRLVIGRSSSRRRGRLVRPMRLAVAFDEVPDGTLVTVVQDGLGDGPAWDGYANQLGPGWERMLGDLKAWLEEGRKCLEGSLPTMTPGPFLAMKVEREARRAV